LFACEPLVCAAWAGNTGHNKVDNGMGGEDRDIDLSMDMPVEASREELVTAYQEACARSDEIACACPSLSTMAKMGPGLA
jgi:hypothetical protein